jgi:hypothetical protein
MKQFTHCFDVRISRQIESDIEDFDDALNAWINSFPSITALRNALLSTTEDTHSLAKGILHSDTWHNKPTLAPATAGDN